MTSMFEPVNDTSHVVILTQNGCQRCGLVKRQLAKANIATLEVNIDTALENPELTRESLREMLPITEMPVVIAYNIYNSGPVLFSGAALDQLRMLTHQWKAIDGTAHAQLSDTDYRQLIDQLNERTDQLPSAIAQLGSDGTLTPF